MFPSECFESNVTETVKYIGGRGKRSLDPKSERDMEELANSIEFEVYKFNAIAASKQLRFTSWNLVGLKK